MQRSTKVAIPRRRGQACEIKAGAKGRKDQKDEVKMTRKSNPKVRTGCETCKSTTRPIGRQTTTADNLLPVRRVKCDEEKPSCRRCTSTGRKCDGYQIPRVSCNGSSETTSACTDLQLSPVISESNLEPIEERSLAYFHAKAALQLAGFDDGKFWEISIPQASRQEPAIHHAVLALSSLHERFIRSDPSLSGSWGADQDTFALTHYNKAIQRLVSPDPESQQKPIDVCLITCMLFYCIEAIRGHTGSSISHVQSGIKVLTELSKGKSKLPRSAIPFTSLSRLGVFFNRLDAATVAMVGTKPMEINNSDASGPPGFQSFIPSTFNSLEEASNSLDYQFNHCLRQAENAHLLTDHDLKSFVYQRPHYFDVFSTWHNSFKTFLTKNPNLTYRHMQQARTLQLLHTLCCIIVRTATDTGEIPEMNFDKNIPMYNRLISLARQIVDTQIAMESDADKKPHFSLEMNITAPLYAVAHRCRDPHLRREAVALMRRCHRREGIWDSLQAAQVAQTVIEIEEQGLIVNSCSDVPSSARITLLSLDFDDEGQVSKVWYMQGLKPENGGPLDMKYALPMPSAVDALNSRC